MTSFHSENLQQALEQYRTRFEAFGELQAEFGGISATASAPRQVVKVTVGSHGQVTDLTFPSGAYRQLTPAELAKTVLTTIQQAFEEAQEKAAKLMGPLMPAGLSAEDVLAGKVDLQSLVADESWLSGFPFAGSSDEK